MQRESHISYYRSWFQSWRVQLRTQMRRHNKHKCAHTLRDKHLDTYSTNLELKLLKQGITYPKKQEKKEESPGQGLQRHSHEIIYNHLAGNWTTLATYWERQKMRIKKLRVQYSRLISLTLITFWIFSNTRGIFAGDTADKTNICLTSQLLEHHNKNKLFKNWKQCWLVFTILN